MRPPSSSLLTLLFNPPLLIRIAPLAHISTATALITAPTRLANPVSQIPNLSYPTCARSFSCAATVRQDFQPTMSGTQSQEELCKNQRNGEGNSAGEDAQKKDAAAVEEKKLPKLSAADFKAYNSMAEHMEYFHNGFRASWNLLYSACLNNTRPKHLSLKSFIATGLQFISHLETHHSIEETWVFPLLARRMPEFKNGKGGAAAELLRQHRAIHKGLEGLEEYLTRCRDGEVPFELPVLKNVMEKDGWGDVLWKHLDQEVATLGAENMRKYWTLEDMRKMPR